MKQRIVWSICLTLLLSATTWSAPKAAPLKAQPAGMDEIRVETSSTADHGPDMGASESWTFRANDTAIHDRSFSVTEAAPDIKGDIGILQPGSFGRMLEFLQWTRLLDTKNGGSGVSVSLRRGGKVKSASIGGASASWTTFAVVDALTKNVVWKTPAQFRTGTGLAVLYQVDDALKGTEAEAAKLFPRPIFSVLNVAGKEVAVLKPNTDKEREAFLSPAPVFTEFWISDKDVSSYFTLAPDTYRFAFKKLDGAAPASGIEFEWRVIGDVTDDFKFSTAKVIPGKFNFIVIRVVKKGAPQT